MPMMAIVSSTMALLTGAVPMRGEPSIGRAPPFLWDVSVRVILCGLISQYNLEDAPRGPNLGPLMACRGKILPMVVYDYENRREEFLRAAIPWFESGQLAYREDVAEGLDNAAAQFCKLMRGENFGKTLVRLL